jgi:hypothetical protein
MTIEVGINYRIQYELGIDTGEVANNFGLQCRMSNAVEC